MSQPPLPGGRYQEVDHEFLLAAGDMDEALKVMAAAQATVRRSRTPNPNQPRDAAKETR